MKVKLFTHTDLDGIGCAILGILAYRKENIDIEYCEYDNVNEKVKEFINNQGFKKYDYVYITDISVNEEVAELIENIHPNNLQLLDHHSTSLWLNNYFWALVNEYLNESKNIKTSGTYMFMEYLKEEELLNNISYFDLFNMIRKYDCWEWKQNKELIPKQLNDLLYIYGRDRFINKYVSLFNTAEKFPLFTEQDLLLLILEQEKIDKYIKSKNEEIIKKLLLNYNVGFVFAEQYHSELGNKLCELNPDIDFAVIINPSKAVSYRSIGDKIHLGEDVAKVFGGGGHINASGSPITDEMRNRIIEIIFE